MAFDGAFLHKVICELNTANDAHIDKIYQPSKDEVVFLLRKKGFQKRLLITTKSGSARIHFTENRLENPSTPPNFCMLLRKYLSSARLISVTQPSLERIAELNFSATNEMGDIVSLTLVCELIGNSSNIILLNGDGKILDALKHSDIETADRLIVPSAKYEYPKSQNKLNPIENDSETILKNITEDIQGSLLNTVCGFSPLICREIEHKSAKTDLKSAFLSVLNDLNYQNIPTAVLTPDGKLLEYSFTTIEQYGSDYKQVTYQSFSELLDSFYSAKDLTARINNAAHDIIRLINNLINRTEKKLSLRLIELKKCNNRETLRINGELLKANLHSIPSGSDFAEVVNYYDPELKTVKIPLNPAISPSKNADKYFKDYKKTYTAEQTLTELTKNDKAELLYFETVLDNIKRSTTLHDIAEIRLELENGGYIKKTASKRPQKSQSFSFKEEKSAEGYRIIIGKNNTQNDYITTKLANKLDLWFHTKNVPGSHVVVMCDGKEVSEQTILYAAALAAENSKAADGENVPVDYTQIKYVKKPSGAKPGMVIYTTNKTVYVTPKEVLL